MSVSQKSIRDKLLQEMKELYKHNYQKIKNLPKSLYKLSISLLIKYPESIFLKAIEIKTFNEEINIKLDKSFPYSLFENENNIFIDEIS